MIPGVNPRQMKAMMKQMGMSQEDLDAQEVIIKSGSRILRFTNPSIQKVVMQGQTTFQLSGDYVEEEEQVKIEISEDDITTVSEQAGVSKEDAMKALENANGDLAQAIVDLS
jgi:nascent polypeptide-associated complex subunit alpha